MRTVQWLQTVLHQRTGLRFSDAVGQRIKKHQFMFDNNSGLVKNIRCPVMKAIRLQSAMEKQRDAFYGLHHDLKVRTRVLSKNLLERKLCWSNVEYDSHPHSGHVYIFFFKKNTVVQYNRKLPEAFWTDYSHQTTNPWNHFASESSKSILSHWAKQKVENPAQKCRKLRTSDRGASKYCHGFHFGWVNFENDCHLDSKRSDRVFDTGKSRDCPARGAQRGRMMNWFQ